MSRIETQSPRKDTARGWHSQWRRAGCREGRERGLELRIGWSSESVSIAASRKSSEGVLTKHRSIRFLTLSLRNRPLLSAVSSRILSPRFRTSFQPRQSERTCWSASPYPRTSNLPMPDPASLSCTYRAVPYFHNVSIQQPQSSYSPNSIVQHSLARFFRFLLLPLVPLLDQFIYPLHLTCPFLLHDLFPEVSSSPLWLHS